MADTIANAMAIIANTMAGTAIDTIMAATAIANPMAGTAIATPVPFAMADFLVAVSFSW